MDIHGAPPQRIPRHRDPSDYRALVAVFLDGGVDGASLLVPLERDERGALEALRPGWVPPATSVRAADRGWGFGPSANAAADLFEAGRLSVVANVGTLQQPITLDQYLSDESSVPKGLFSHGPQKTAWQTGDPGSNSAWLSRLARAGAHINPDPDAGNAFAFAKPAPLFSGEHREVEVNAEAYAHATSGMPAPLARLAPASGSLLNAARPVSGLPGSSLGQQLARVVSSIEHGRTHGERRQIFHVVQYGWDRHRTSAVDIATLWTELTEALRAFDQALVVRGLSGGVTTFTASEFGRAAKPSKRGLDHGWGTHHLVMGSSIRGGRIMGEPPTYAPTALNHVGGGRWIPTLATCQYAASLAESFGLRRGQLDSLFPSLGNFKGGVLPIHRTRHLI